MRLRSQISFSKKKTRREAGQVRQQGLPTGAANKGKSVERSGRQLAGLAFGHEGHHRLVLRRIGGAVADGLAER